MSLICFYEKMSACTAVFFHSNTKIFGNYVNYIHSLLSALEIYLQQSCCRCNAVLFMEAFPTTDELIVFDDLEGKEETYR